MLRKYFETAMKIRGNSVNYFHSFLPIRFPQADSDKRMHRKDAIKLGNCLWKFGCIIQIVSYKVTWWHGDNGHIHHHRHHYHADTLIHTVTSDTGHGTELHSVNIEKLSAQMIYKIFCMTTTQNERIVSWLYVFQKSVLLVTSGAAPINLYMSDQITS